MQFSKIFTLVIVLLLSSSSFARGDGKEKGKGKFGKFLKELNLTEDQIKKLKEHRKANKDQPRPDRSEMKTLREEMKKAFINGASDSEMTALSNKIQKAKEDMNARRLKKMIFFKNLLTKEQRQKFMEKRKSRRGQRGGNDGGMSFD